MWELEYTTTFARSPFKIHVRPYILEISTRIFKDTKIYVDAHKNT
jgi:hypothetical protein